MISVSQLALLRSADNNALLPGVDTPTGNQVSASSLLQLWQFSRAAGADYTYDPVNNMVRVIKAGAVLNGINFGSATVQIMANNVTIENCTFTGTTGWYSVDQLSGNYGAVIKNNTFNNPAQSLKLSAFIESRNTITIANNTFLNSPADGLDIGAGTVSGNYFSGAGYTSNGTHPDAIWVTETTGPVVITNNFIDWTTNPTSTYSTNDCIRITTELGNAENITVTGNYLIGGATVVDAGNEGSAGIFANINISNNYIGFGKYYDFFPGPQTGVTGTGNVIFDFTNPAYSNAAWASFLAGGMVTNSLVTATAAQTSISAAATGTSTLYGNGENIHLFGGASETIFIGGGGVQYDWGGWGQNIFSYLSIGDSTQLAADDLGNFHVATDVIDLHAINANPASSSTVNFTFIGSAAFSGAGGEVRVVQDVASGQTYVLADMAGDSSADMKIRLNGLLNLTAANFALTTAQYNADIAAYTTIASFLGSQTSLDQVAGGFSIVDSLANVQPNLAALQADAGNINAVTSTSGVIAVNAATFAADQTILNKFAGGFAVVDTGANILAQIGALECDASAITSVMLNDSTKASPDVLTLSASNAAADTAILAKIASPYLLVAIGASATTVTGQGAGSTINIGPDGFGFLGNPVTVTGGGKGDTFNFSAQFGSVEITDFSTNVYGATPDSISLSTADFANWNTLLADGHANGASTTFISADGASLTVDGISLTTFQHASGVLRADFAFHA